MQGYWRRPDDTREMLRTNDRGERLLFTGDLGYLDEDGYVFIVDRKKDLIKTCGFRCGRGRSRKSYRRIPQSRRLESSGLPDQMRGETVKAWIVLRPGHSQRLEPS